MRNILFILLIVYSFDLSAQSKAEPYDKGEFRLDFGLPYFNFISINPIDEPRSKKFGFVGEALGIEYSITDDRFIELGIGIGVTSNFFIPVPVLKEGEYKILSSIYLSSTMNHVVSRFTFGYGLNFSINELNQGARSLGDTLVEDYSNNKINRAFGITLNSFFRLGKTANFGIIYKPTFYNIDPRPIFNYDHLISFAFLWRFRLNNK